MGRPYYAIQPAFTGGEISEDVAARIDIDKYQLSLLQAKNVIINPYGSIKKRPGLKYCGSTKNNGRAILKKFEFTPELSYMLEVGEGYIRIWRDGAYLGIELQTPFTGVDLQNMRTLQNIDVMYICTGRHPVYKLMRYTENNWQLTEIDWYIPPFAEINDNENVKITPSGTKGTITITANSNIFSANNVGDYIKIMQRVSASDITEEIAAGTEPATTTNRTTGSILAGDSWKVLTRGTWTGSVVIEQSTDDGLTWSDMRHYESNDDYNVTESGNVEEKTKLRARVTVSSGTCRLSLSTFPYTNEGVAKITAANSASSITAVVIETIGTTEPTANFYLSAWGKNKGYPYTVAFFQDRLCFGGSPTYPQRLWMSRSGEYENFAVDKEAGTVTDDSAVTVELLSTKAYRINHLLSSNDLIILTEGNTWTIDGGETVTPSNITPRNQENYGANDVSPMKVSSRHVYVQKRGGTVRDVGYSYTSDSYSGTDLTLLAKHLIQDKTLVDGVYAQEPDSILYFVRSDGVLLCLTYVPEQKVFAWSRIETKGKIEAVTAIAQGNNDRVYVISNRTINGSVRRYLEVLDVDKRSESQQDYNMVDSYKNFNSNTATAVLTGLSHLEGQAVQVLADGYYYDDKTYVVSNGQITLPEKVKKAVVGLGYEMVVEQANFEAGNTESGTLQGRDKMISSAILRLVKSYGGKIGPVSTALNEIIYDPSRLETGQDVLYSGDKEVVLGTGGYDTYGRVYIEQNTPYPFILSAIIREVTL
ncbi:MAG: hypothetical protein II430_00300 [Selenomonas sp.]|nr:hypothetical protein [Selenomonas sp.]